MQHSAAFGKPQVDRVRRHIKPRTIARFAETARKTPPEVRFLCLQAGSISGSRRGGPPRAAPGGRQRGRRVLSTCFDATVHTLPRVHDAPLRRAPRSAPVRHASPKLSLGPPPWLRLSHLRLWVDDTRRPRCRVHANRPDRMGGVPHCRLVLLPPLEVWQQRTHERYRLVQAHT